MATIDYMICAYGPYSASATGGNGWSRDFLAGVLTIPATPFFTNIGADTGNNLEYACTILACISALLVCAVYAVYWWGPWLRKRSEFAQRLANEARNNSVDGTARRASSMAYPGSRRASKLHHASMKARTCANASSPGAVQRPGVGERSYSRQGQFFGQSRQSTPRGTPSASRANSVAGALPRSGNRTPQQRL